MTSSTYAARVKRSFKPRVSAYGVKESYECKSAKRKVVELGGTCSSAEQQGDEEKCQKCLEEGMKSIKKATSLKNCDLSGVLGSISSIIDGGKACLEMDFEAPSEVQHELGF